MAQGQVDYGVLQDTKLTYGVYRRYSSGFWVPEMAETSAHSSDITFFYRKTEHFAIEELCLQSPNVIRFQLVTGRQRWHIVG